MKKIILTLTIAAIAPQVWAVSGNDLLKQGEAFERMTRKAGTLEDSGDASFFMGFVGGAAFILNDSDPKVCLPSRGSVGQYGSVVYQYLRQNPAQLHRPAQALVREALERAFPCR